jgi:dephospho-CoA kinase
MPAIDKSARADYVIRTDGTFEETEVQIEHVLRLLLP